jgi:dipeptidyl aminopeptidase/acylaminoacyl peptidase
MLPLRWSICTIAGILATAVSAARTSDRPWENLPNGVLGQVADFEGAGGVPIAGYIRRPAGPGPFPLVIVLHGAGPTARPVRDDDPQVLSKKRAAEALRASQVLGRASSPPIPDFLAQGWAVYTIDYRPNPRYTLDPLELDDTMIAVNKARSFAFVDPKRIATFGGSHGGHVTARMASRVDLACALVCAPAGLDLIALAHQAEQGARIGGNQRLVRELEQRSGVKMAEIEKHPEAYQYSSLFTEVAHVRCPILLISGRDDINAPLPVMDAYVDKLRAAGKETETYHPDNGPRGFYAGLPCPIPETAESAHRAVAFIKMHFERPAPASAGTPQE